MFNLMDMYCFSALAYIEDAYGDDNMLNDCTDNLIIEDADSFLEEFDDSLSSQYISVRSETVVGGEYICVLFSKLKTIMRNI